MDSARLLLRGGLFSGGLSPGGLAARQRLSLGVFRPYARRRVDNPGSFFVKLRLKPLPFVLAVRPQRIRNLSDLPFHKCRGEIRWTALWQSKAIACVSV